MSEYENEAKKILGARVFRLLCDAASEDKINDQKLKDISYRLHGRVGGNHQKRGRGSSESELRAVISDWYQVEMFDMTRETALNKLVKILEDPSVNLKPLAKDINDLQRATDEVSL